MKIRTCSVCGYPLTVRALPHEGVMGGKPPQCPNRKLHPNRPTCPKCGSTVVHRVSQGALTCETPGCGVEFVPTGWQRRGFGGPPREPREEGE